MYKEAFLITIENNRLTEVFLSVRKTVPDILVCSEYYRCVFGNVLICITSLLFYYFENSKTKGTNFQMICMFRFSLPLFLETFFASTIIQ
jgi:hypothetical protein